MVGDWDGELRRKLEEHWLDPIAAEKVTDEVVRLVPFAPAERKRPCAKRWTYSFLGGIVLATAAGSAVANSQLHAHALGYMVAGAGVAWGTFLLWRGWAQRR
jgi:hypothetical protein